MPTRIREAAATKDGLPRKAYAYAPTAKPDDWQLPIYKADGAVDDGRLPAAAAALSEAGIPAVALPNVKARLRSAYRKWKGSDAEYPAAIKEAEVMLREAESGPAVATIREATVLLDKSAVCATVVVAPNGDMLVVPNWDGQFQSLAKPYQSPSESPYDASWDVSDIAGVIGTLTRVRAREMDDPIQQAMLDRAINGAADFIRSEATEVTEAKALEADALALIAEAGKRNSSSDSKLLQTIHDATHDLGAEHTEGRSYKGMENASAKALAQANAKSIREAKVEIDETGTREQVKFAEGSEDGSAFVLLSEAAATFNDATRTVTITPIKPGFGNKRDGFYYPTETLREATANGLFDHLKMYRNHPRKSDEKDLPERAVEDWFATTREASWDEASESPRVEVKVHDAVDYAKWKDAPEQIAFSVRGGGYARAGRVEGQEAKVLESLTKVRSVDWVTEAGAGGAITFAESASSEEIEMDIKALSVEQLREELRLREAADGAVAEPEAKVEAKVEDDPKVEAPEVEAPKAEAKVETPAIEAPEGFVKAADVEAIVAKSLADRDAAAIAKTAVQEAAKAAIADEIGKSTLTRAVKGAVAVRFAEAGWGNGFTYTDEPQLRGAVKGELENAAKLLAAAGRAPSPVKGLGAEAPEGTATISEATEARIAARWGSDPMPKKPTLVYDADELVGATPKDPKKDPEEISESESPTDAATARIAARMGI